MFSGYIGDYIDCSDWENPKVTNFRSMFYESEAKSINM
jgi:hypothetical protein